MNTVINSHFVKVQMSDLDVKAIVANFVGWKMERADHLSDSAAFERYTIEQILKDYDLSDEEIESGHFGGPDDGGVDAMYFFVNRTLIQDETELPDPALTAELVIIQTKYESGFKENTVERLFGFSRDLLDYSKSINELTYLNSLAKDAIIRFRERYDSMLGSPHQLSIYFHYATKSDAAPNNKVNKRVRNLEDFVKQKISAAQFAFEFWDCRRLLHAARSSPKREFTLEMTKQLATDDGRAVACLVGLKNFAAFLTDEKGGLRRSILEPNVRDYQGSRNPVNKDIRTSFESSNGPEFWWLNNGITLLASRYSVVGNKLTVEKPEIVNGLQTSQEIFSHFKDNPDKQDSRNVLIRIILPPEEQTRSKITKATNFQIKVEAVSLHATDQIHFDIEDKLKLYGLFYDRRKGEYRNRRKPISKIISIPTLAKAVIAIVLRQPDNARARPQTLLNKDEIYTQIFNDHYNRDIFVACILLDRQVDQYLSTKADLSRDTRRNIRYYVDTWLACALTEGAEPAPTEIANLLPHCNKPLSNDVLEDAYRNALTIYEELGATDKIAKGSEYREKLISVLKTRFAPNDETIAQS